MRLAEADKIKTSLQLELAICLGSICDAGQGDAAVNETEQLLRGAPRADGDTIRRHAGLGRASHAGHEDAAAPDLLAAAPSPAPASTGSFQLSFVLRQPAEFHSPQYYFADRLLAGSPAEVVASALPGGPLAPLAGSSPGIVSISPSSGATSVGLTQHIVITFDEPVKAKSGGISIVHGGNSESIPITMPGIVTFSGNTMTIVPDIYFAQGTDYQVTISGGSIQGTGGDVLTTQIAFSFHTEGTTDANAPQLVSSSLADGEPAVGLSPTFSFSFSTQIKAGTGNIEIRNQSDGSLYESIAVTDTSHVSMAGSSLFVAATTPLQLHTGYYIVFGSGVVLDQAGHSFAGIPSSSTLDFVTIDGSGPPPDTTPPTLVDSVPQDGQSGVPQTFSVALVFSENVKAGTGNIVIHNASDGSVFASVSIADSAHVTFNGNTVSVQHPNFVPGASYYVTVDSGAVTDLAGNPFAGISSPTAFDFKVAPTIVIDDGTYTNAAGHEIDIGAGETTVVVGFKLVDYPAPELVPSLTNAGTIHVSYDGLGSVAGVVDEEGGLFDGSLFWNKAGATYIVSSSTDAVAYGFDSLEFSGDVRNDGTFTVTSAHGIGFGVVTPDATFSFINTGTVSITGGLYAEGYVDKNGGSFFNSGSFTVTSTGDLDATGVSFFGAFSFNNSGTFTVSDNLGDSRGVVFAPGDPVQQVLTNSGIITADVAFWEVQNFNPQGPTDVLIDNSGTINGAIELDSLYDTVGNIKHTVHNTGTIHGDITFGPGDDVFNGASGTYTGTMTGGAGNDLFQLGKGNDVLDAGPGDDTATFTGPRSDYTITYDGPRTIVSGDGGTHVLTNVEHLQFADGSAAPAAPGLIIQVHYDASVDSAPAGFKDVVAAVVQYFESTFNDPVTINIDVGYGEVGGTALDSGALGESQIALMGISFLGIIGALTADKTSLDDTSAVANLPSLNPFVTGQVLISQAEAKALGLLSAPTMTDGAIGFSSSYAFDFNNGDGVGPGTYDFFGVVAHEISEIMGRVLGAGQGIDGLPSYFPLDMFHYSGSGSPLYVGTTAGYFSIDGGATNLANFNIDPTGDFGDWADSAGNDAFRAFMASGQVFPVTAADIAALDVIGYNKTSADQAPVLAGGGTVVSYLEQAPGVVIDAGLTVADADTTVMTGAAITILSGAAPSDWLNFTTQNGITGNFNSVTETLTLTGAATVAAYQAALRSISFSNAGDNPTPNGDTVRTIGFSVYDGTRYSAVATTTINVTGINDPPVLSGAGNTVGYVEQAAGVILVPNLPISDFDSPLLAGATVKISSGFVAGDTLNFVNQNGIVGSYNAATHVLTLTGSAPALAYQNAFQSVTFSSNSDNPTNYDANTTRTITWTVDDGSATNHLSNSVISTLTVTGVDDPSILHNDAFAMGEQYPIGDGLNVFANNGQGADSDPDTILRIVAVNGSAASVGQQIALASGALLTVRADGSFVYDPNDAFDSLAAPGSGSTNTSATDSFTYTVTGGTIETATVTITGVDSNDTLHGTAGNDTLDGGIGTDTLMLSGNQSDYAITYNVSTRVYTVVDQRGGSPDGTDQVKNVENFHFANGTVSYALYTQTVVNGDGTTTTTTQDAADDHPWASQAATFDTQGSLAAQTVVLDNGGSRVNVYDTAAAASWLWTSTAFDAGGHQLSQVGTNDDGTHWLTLNDVANAYKWTSATLTFDAGWNQTGLSGTNDDGSHTLAMKDIAAALDTLLWFTTPYDANLGGAPMDMVLTGGANHDDLFGFGGNDTLSGGGNSDILTGGQGNDTLTGGAGDDRFVFKFGDGLDVVTDFSPGAASGDLIDLHGYGVTSFASLQSLMTQVGGDTLIAFDDQNHILLQGVLMSQLNSGDFVFS